MRVFLLRNMMGAGALQGSFAPAKAWGWWMLSE